MSNNINDFYLESTANDNIMFDSVYGSEKYDMIFDVGGDLLDLTLDESTEKLIESVNINESDMQDDKFKGEPEDDYTKKEGCGNRKMEGCKKKCENTSELDEMFNDYDDDYDDNDDYDDDDDYDDNNSDDDRYDNQYDYSDNDYLDPLDEKRCNNESTSTTKDLDNLFSEDYSEIQTKNYDHTIPDEFGDSVYMDSVDAEVDEDLGDDGIDAYPGASYCLTSDFERYMKDLK